MVHPVSIDRYRPPRAAPSSRAAKSVILALMLLPAADAQLVQIVDAALADAARRAGPLLACRPGCTQCCHGAFAINSLDALRLADGMNVLRAHNPALAGQIERRALLWIGAHEQDFPGDPATGLLGDSDEDLERFDAFANDEPCPALDPATGLCDAYESRPMTCRVFGPPVRMDGGTEGADALGHCELCFHGASPSEVAACEMPLPHELEASLLDELPALRDTVVAFALVGRGLASTR
jgi:Fe-S-cluster containining protein